MKQRRVSQLRPEEMTRAQRALYDEITTGPRARGPQYFDLTDAEGRLNGPFGDFLLSPILGNALQQLGSVLRYKTTLTDRSRELAILLVAAHHKSDFERRAHQSIARSLGFGDLQLQSITFRDMSPFPEEEALIGRIVLAMLAGDLDESQWEEASKRLGPEQVFELVTLVGYYSALALQLRVFRADSFEG